MAPTLEAHPSQLHHSLYQVRSKEKWKKRKEEKKRTEDSFFINNNEKQLIFIVVGVLITIGRVKLQFKVLIITEETLQYTLPVCFRITTAIQHLTHSLLHFEAAVTTYLVVKEIARVLKQHPSNVPCYKWLSIRVTDE